MTLAAIWFAMYSVLPFNAMAELIQLQAAVATCVKALVARSRINLKRAK